MLCLCDALRVATVLVLCALVSCIEAAMDPASAEGRTINKHAIIFDLPAGEVVDGSTIQSPKQIFDRTFVDLDLKIIVNNETAEAIQKMVDQGFTAEPAGCAPGAFGPLDMEDGLRYFFETPDVDGQKVRATIYPGNRSTHWTNDVFCEFDKTAGSLAIFRLTGFFFVIHRNIEGGIDVQLRPIVLLPDEISKYLGGE